MKSPLLIAVLILSAAALLLGAGCSSVSSVGVDGTYTSKSGDSYSGGVNVGIRPTPTPADRSK